MTLPTITATGYLVRNPVLLLTSDMTPVCRARIACRDGRDAVTLTADLPGAAAERAVRALRRGEPVEVTGVLLQRGGRDRPVYRIRATDLRRADAPGDAND